MEHLAGHPNIVVLHSAFEDKTHVHLVLELCTGGELFDRIAARGHFSERTAAQLMSTIVSVVAHCHKRHIIHRDLKPENFLLADRSPSAPLKVTDFGLSVFFKEGAAHGHSIGGAGRESDAMLEVGRGNCSAIVGLQYPRMWPMRPEACLWRKAASMFGAVAALAWSSDSVLHWLLPLCDVAGEVLLGCQGSPYYVAPECIKGKYGKECDV